MFVFLNSFFPKSPQLHLDSNRSLINRNAIV